MRQSTVGDTISKLALIFQDDAITFDTLQRLAKSCVAHRPTGEAAFSTAVMNWPPGQPVTGPELYMLGVAVSEGLVEVYYRQPSKHTLVGREVAAAWPFPVRPGSGGPR